MNNDFSGAIELLRSTSFFALLIYIPIRFGIGFDFSSKPYSRSDVKNEIKSQIAKINISTPINAIISALRLAGIVYLNMWLLIDKSIFLIIPSFLFSVAFFYFHKIS